MDAHDDLAPLVDGATALGISMDDSQLDQFRRFRDLLLDANTRVNLTAITDPAEVVIRHFLDSLACLLAVAGIYAAFVFHRMTQFALVPVGDPRLQRSLHFQNA
jgi:hypothetical protein